MSPNKELIEELKFNLLIGVIHIYSSVPSIFRWIAVLLLLAMPPIYLAYHPAHYTPLVDSLLSILLFLLAYWIGNRNELAKATKSANDRWLPQAESVVLRLMTLHSNVQRFSYTTKLSCSKSECDLPELRDEHLRAVRIKLKTDCESSSQRLDDIAHQLEDAIEDWRRFITANCDGLECQRIFEALAQRQNKLELEMGLTKVSTAAQVV